MLYISLGVYVTPFTCMYTTINICDNILSMLYVLKAFDNVDLPPLLEWRSLYWTMHDENFYIASPTCNVFSVKGIIQ